MKKVFITGIESFTGRHLRNYLERAGYSVYGSVLQKSDADPAIFGCDITDKASCAQLLQKVEPHFIIHLAGIAFVGHGESEDFYRVNTIGTGNLLDAIDAMPTKPQKVIVVSSATVYGNQNATLLEESMCPKPTNHYAISKYGVESLAATYFKKFPIVVSRPFNYTGVGQSEDFLIPKIVAHFKEGKKSIELGNLHVRREFNDVAFVCEAYKRLLESSVESVVLNIASNRGIALLDVIEMMQAIAGYTIEVKVNPAFVRKNEIATLTGSAQKLFAAVGSIEQKPLQETLKDMFEA